MLWRKRRQDLINWINNGKEALLVTGARQVGKTFLIEETLKETNSDYVVFNKDEEETLELKKIDLSNL